MSELQTRILSALEALAAALNASAAPSMIIGGIAVIANGVPRLTADIDATIWAERIDLVPVASPDDLIVYKALAWRERDRTDIERLLLAHFDTVDLDRVRARVREFAEAIDDPDRPEQLERLIQRVARLSR